MTQTEVKNFLEKNINLDKERYLQINKKYKETKEIIESQMDGVVVYKQGSMATKTAIRPKNPEHEYDLDVAVTKGIEDIPEFTREKDILQVILMDEYNEVERKAKCINVNWTKNFNGDFVIMHKNGDKQSIFDESNFKVINSNNLTLANDINALFSTANNDALRDASKLMKFYLRQHEKTNGLIPSIALNILIMTNYASKDLGYVGQMITTINNIAHKFSSLIKQGKFYKGIKNPTNGELIEYKIKNTEDMKNIALVLQDLAIDINNNLRALNFNSDIRSQYESSSISEKPYSWLTKK